MKFLFVIKQKKNFDTFRSTCAALLERGHTVTLAVQEGRDERVRELAAGLEGPRFQVVIPPLTRPDAWADSAPLLRSLADCLHYQQPALHDATKLQARTLEKLQEELRLGVDAAAASAALRDVPPTQIQALRQLVDLAERALPVDPLLEAFLREQAPDVLLVSPLVHFGSAQADLVAAARRVGLPVGMLLFSWDNLSTKGRIHQAPDVLFVWNERQREEAGRLHGFPAGRVVVVGAPRFDAFFGLAPLLNRHDFLTPLGLDPAEATLLYVCSSPFVSPKELAFVERWRGSLRAAGGRLATANLIVRPHPDIALLGDDVPVEQFRWPAASGLQGLLSRPFDDPRAIVLRTSDRAQQGLFECLHHSAAVVGLNTSAELEAAIVGRPVYTVLAGTDDADGQSSTLHFHYLTESGGGCVCVAPGLDQHVAQLAHELAEPSDPARLQAFAREFLRPGLTNGTVGEALAAAVEQAFAGRTTADAGARPDGAGLSADELPAGSDVPFADAVSGAGTEVDDEAAGLDKFERRWMAKFVKIGDPVHDVSAGLGEAAVFLAKQRGAPVVAFEPGFVAYAALCENLRRHSCDGTVIPLPLAIGAHEGLVTLKYPAGLAGGARHAVRSTDWAPRRPAGEDRPLVMPVAATTLDAAVPRYALPPPRHLRVSDPAITCAVLTGAAAQLAASVQSVFARVDPEDQVRVDGLMTAAGFELRASKESRRGTLLQIFVRRDAAVP